MTGLAEAIVDLDAIAHNTRLLAEAVGNAQLMAVVKANGFGHGATAIARTALAGGASWLGVTSLSEALELRAQGITAPLLMWLYAPDEDLARATEHDIDVSVSSVAALEKLAAGRPANVHLKADTGLSRAGATADEWPHLITAAARLQDRGRVRVRGIWSHLAHAENPADPALRRQLDAFADARAQAAAGGVVAPLTHLANSAAALQLPATHFDLVRAGIALYGIEPVTGREFGLRPAMTLRATVILTKRVPAGSGVSYGPDHVTDRETTLALVPVGFADGVPRAAAGRAEVNVRGINCPVIGRIAMDQIVVDVGSLPVRAGDAVTVFGPGAAGEPTVADWARWAGTNPHEILTGVGPRVPRRYEGQTGPSSVQVTPRLRQRQNGWPTGSV
ncbi:alanine racemase [Actinoplanes solisilvae]|uniref:alanine racemase n=1 Tax=Actinoplanes solisilvae TaxID=2486853 RepID=UPI000FDC95F4|nr:alanine racemase [Actinoplanes solisilvae]